MSSGTSAASQHAATTLVFYEHTKKIYWLVFAEVLQFHLNFQFCNLKLKNQLNWYVSIIVQWL